MTLTESKVETICSVLKPNGWTRFGFNHGHIEIRCAECPTIFHAGVEIRGHLNIGGTGLIPPEAIEANLQEAVYLICKYARGTNATT